MSDESTGPRILRLLRASGRVAWQVVGVAVAIYLLGRVFELLQHVLLSVFVALVLGALVTPIGRRIEGWGLNRTLATGVGLVLVVGVLGGSIGFVGVRLFEELPSLVEDVKAQREPVLEWLSREPLSLSEEEVMAVLNRGIEEASQASAGEDAPPPPADPEELEGDGEGPEPGVTVAMLRGAFATTRTLGFVLIGVVLAFFVVRDRDRIADGVVRFAAGGRHDSVGYAALRRGWRALHGYVRGSMIVGAIDATLIGVVLFVIGVPLAGVLTVLTFLGGFVPVAGATVAGLLAVGVTTLDQGFGVGGALLAWIIVVQQLDGHILQPLVMSHETNLHPIVTILALTVGGIVGGLLGALLAIPVAAVLTNMAAEMLEASSLSTDGPGIVEGEIADPA